MRDPRFLSLVFDPQLSCPTLDVTVHAHTALEHPTCRHCGESRNPLVIVTKTQYSDRRGIAGQARNDEFLLKFQLGREL